MAVTQVIREKFFNGYREAEFIVVCDVLRENSRVMKELNNAQVNPINIYLLKYKLFNITIFLIV